MPKLWDMLSPLSKVNLARVYKNLTGLEFVPPKEEKHQVMVPQMESLQEIEKIMQENRGVWHE